MAFDPCEHQKVEIIKRAGAIIRSLRGLPEEKNITILYNETMEILGLVPIRMDSRMADHLPSPEEMRNEKGEFEVPNKPCPKCGMRSFLTSICQSCKDAEGGKYRSGYACDIKHGGCGFSLGGY